MKNFLKAFPAKTFSAMEIDAETVTIVIADKKDGGCLRILGSAETAVGGLEKGEVTHPGDFAESIAGAAQKAEQAAGARIEKLYYNLDDPKIESAWLVGSKILDGEGEIRPQDVRSAVAAAERLAGNFEKKIVYSAEADYVIDDKDPVADPVGIFGHKLDVKVHLVLASAARMDLWTHLLRRAGFFVTAPVLSGLSSAYGVLSPEERQGQRIVWDLGRDYWNGLVLSGGRVREYRAFLSAAAEWGPASDVVLAVSQELKKKHPGVSEVVLTGELSKDLRRSADLAAGLDIPSRSLSPRGMAPLDSPAHASLAGLLEVAGEIEKKAVVMRPEKDTLSHAREKVRLFLSDYF